MKRFGMLPLAVLMIVGCSGGASSVVGKWKGTIEMGEQKKDDPGASMAKAFGDMLGGAISFEFKSDKTFTGTLLFPVEGTYSVSGNTVTLEIKKMMGMEAKGDNAKDQKPLVFTMAPDGKSMSAKDPTGKQNGEFRLTRE